MKHHMTRPIQSSKNTGWGGVERPEAPTPPPYRVIEDGHIGHPVILSVTFAVILMLHMFGVIYNVT